MQKEVKIQAPQRAHFHAVNDVGEQNTFLKQNFFNAFLNRITAKICINVNWPILTNPVGAIFRLGLDRRIPPAIEVKDARSASEVQANTAGAERQHQSVSLYVALEFRDAARARCWAHIADQQ